ncbi:MAG: L-2-hydroxyglutarate oxidase [Actinomycetota bacterium]|jgi:(S)-2-hydroxyglutarate dehydrogenase
MRPDWDVVVIGGGIIGLATAYQLLVAGPDLRVLVLEKEPRVGLHQSSHNSGVLHAGLYYAPDSLKARLCSRGRRRMEEFAADHGIPVVRRGKVVVAVDESELGRLDELAHRARRNGVEGLRMLDTAELRELEPHVVGIKALYSSSTAVIDFSLVCEALANEISARGGEIRTHAEVLALREVRSAVRITSLAGEFESETAVVCAGLQADRLAAETGHATGVRILPFRGNWFSLRPRAAALVNGNVYPVPDPRFPFLGVHFTRRVDGSVWAGPNAIVSACREAYQRGTVNPADIADLVRFRGTWRLVRRYWRQGAKELYHDLVRRAAHAEMVRYLPGLALADLLPGPTGIRAQAVRDDGSLVDDFLLRGTRRIVHVLNAPSPGATSSLAIGELIGAEVGEKVRLARA